jgi:hypothetical protein
VVQHGLALHLCDLPALSAAIVVLRVNCSQTPPYVLISRVGTRRE